MDPTVEDRAVHLAPEETPTSPDHQQRDQASQEAIRPTEPGFEKALAEMIEKEVARRFQSAKDKRWAALEKKYGDLHELSEQAQAAAVPEPNSNAGETETDFQSRIHALANLPGIRENEEALTLILRNQNPPDQQTYTALVEAILQTALGDGAPPNHPDIASAASVVIPGGGEAPHDLAQDYQRRKRHLRPGDVNALTALKREFRQKGLDVF